MGILTPLYRLPNHVLDKQKYYQNSTRPLIYRGPRAGLYVGVYYTLFAAGMASTTFAIVSLIKGKKQE